MKFYLKFSVIALILILLVGTHSLFACTIISASHIDKTFFGGNEDQTPTSSYFVINKTGTYGALYFATIGKKNHPVMQMGINELGLSFDANQIPIEKIIPHPEKASPQELMKNVLGELSSVEEALTKLSSYNWGDSVSGQLHFADKSGEAAVIHPGLDGEFAFVRKLKIKGHLVSTNFNIANLKKNNWHCPRYKTADEILSNAIKNNDLTVETMASVLKATQQNGRIKTLFSVVFDLSHLRVYLYYDRRFDVPYILDVKEELSIDGDIRIISLEDLIEKM
ncbi:MAG: linear amide C-N hydrolase [Deltaproteobacteria bacterium]|nr:linear amide C-N hydrolase [Deltaproteobacteria bacterium]